MDRKEAIDIVRKNWPDGRHQLSVALETLIPELKESEDEKIRKCVKILVNGLTEEHFVRCGASLNEIHAWLKKQDERNNFYDTIQIGDHVTKNEDGMLVNLSQLKRVAKPADIVESKKQDEHKQNPYSGVSFDYNGHTWGMCARDCGVEILIDGQLKGRVFTEDANTKEMFIKALEHVEELSAKGYKITDCDKNSWWEDFKAYCGYSEQNSANFIKTRKVEQKPAMIQWKGNNLKEVIDFTGKDKNFENWFKSFEEYEQYVQKHNGIFKLFNADGSHYEVPVGAWIVKTPDGYNVPSKAKYQQKSTDKVEPKFKVGDWVVEPREDKPNYLWHIDRIKDDYYRYDAIKAGIKIDYADKKCYLWTIQDAKDGDVLVCSVQCHGEKMEQVGIFKEYIGRYGGCSNSFKIYAGIDWDKHLLIDNIMGSSEIYPATKEQRDTLFAKMKEAGYEWDAEKKELKKKIL